MSKRFGRSQKRKLKIQVESLQHSLNYMSNRLEAELSKSTKVQGEILYHVYDTTYNMPLSRSTNAPIINDVKVETLPLHQLQTEYYKDNNPYAKELYKMIVVEARLSDNTVAYRYSEELLKRMDKDSLKYYLTDHMADLLIDSLRGV